MISLGIDPSFSGYGWCTHDSDDVGLKRRISSGHEETFSSMVPVARYVHYRSLVERLLSTFQPQVVGIESPAYTGTFQVVHHTLMMYALEAIFNSRIDCVLFDPSTLKSLARGNRKNKTGPMMKLDMQRFVQLDTMDSNVIDNNEADAYCVAYFAARFFDTYNGKIDPKNLTESEFNTFIGRTKKVKTLTGTKVKRVSHVFRENSRFFQFSKIPSGKLDLPKKSQVNQDLLDFLDSLES